MENPSGDITNLPHLIKVARLGKPILLSTGMSTMEEVKAAVSVLRTNYAPDITVLHCTTEYPAPIEDVNLGYECNGVKVCVPVGYSDQAAGIEIPMRSSPRQRLSKSISLSIEQWKARITKQV